MDVSPWIVFALGLGALILGADILVRGAARLAAAAGITPLVIGLTVVAFGTSAPEMAVSVTSALSGQAGADLALGNVVGSNIFNILLILGLSAAISPLVVAQKLVRIEVPLMVAVSLLVLWLAWDGTLSRANGLLLFVGIVAYTVFAVMESRRESKEIEAEYNEAYGRAATKAPQLPRNLGLIAVGLVLLVLGSDWLVDSAVTIARGFGISELVIGLTIVAAGTSMPELATSVIAAIKGERDIAVGNVIGSNLFNLMSVLGLAALVAPGGIQVPASALQFDLPIMIGACVACLPVFFTGYTIARWEGWLFLGYYIAYVSFLILNATQHAALDRLETAMLGFVIPLTVLTLLIVALRQIKSARRL